MNRNRSEHRGKNSYRGHRGRGNSRYSRKLNVPEKPVPSIATVITKKNNEYNLLCFFKYDGSINFTIGGVAKKAQSPEEQIRLELEQEIGSQEFKMIHHVPDYFKYCKSEKLGKSHYFITIIEQELERSDEIYGHVLIPISKLHSIYRFINSHYAALQIYYTLKFLQSVLNVQTTSILDTLIPHLRYKKIRVTRLSHKKTCVIEEFPNLCTLCEEQKCSCRTVPLI